MPVTLVGGSQNSRWVTPEELPAVLEDVTPLLEGAPTKDDDTIPTPEALLGGTNRDEDGAAALELLDMAEDAMAWDVPPEVPEVLDVAPAALLELPVMEVDGPLSPDPTPVALLPPCEVRPVVDVELVPITELPADDPLRELLAAALLPPWEDGRLTAPEEPPDAVCPPGRHTVLLQVSSAAQSPGVEQLRRQTPSMHWEPLAQSWLVEHGANGGVMQALIHPVHARASSTRVCPVAAMVIPFLPHQGGTCCRI